MTPQRETVYLDYNATTPYAPSVKQTMTAAAEDNWGNPSSNYRRGKQAKKQIEDSRRLVADMIGAKPSEVIFVSGGTEANNMAITSVLEQWKSTLKSVPHVITTKIEHDATLKLVEHVSGTGEIKVTFLPTNLDGSVNSKDVVDAIQKETALITLMMANNETGAITDVKKLSEGLTEVNRRREKENLSRVYLHVDAAQAIGKIPVSVKETPVDYLTIVGHKFYGPRTGALYVREGGPVTPLVKGGSQENRRRPGTENMVCIAGQKWGKLEMNGLWRRTVFGCSFLPDVHFPDAPRDPFFPTFPDFWHQTLSVLMSEHHSLGIQSSYGIRAQQIMQTVVRRWIYNIQECFLSCFKENNHLQEDIGNVRLSVVRNLRDFGRISKMFDSGLRDDFECTLFPGLGEASRLVLDNLSQYHDHMAKIKDYLKTSLLKEFPKRTCVVNFPETPERPQLPNTLSISFPGLCGSRILEKCPELEASTGAACHSTINKNTASNMLTILLPEEQAIGTIRLSVGRDTTTNEIDLAIIYIREAVKLFT